MGFIADRAGAAVKDAVLQHRPQVRDTKVPCTAQLNGNTDSKRSKGTESAYC